MIWPWNVSGRKRRLASEARYRRLFEAAQDGILILDAQSGLIIDGNCEAERRLHIRVTVSRARAQRSNFIFPEWPKEPTLWCSPMQKQRFREDSETILVLEDDEPVRELAIQMLQDAGYQIIEARNAEYALDLMKASKPGSDLLLTDVIMPGKSGVELLEQAKVVYPNLRSLFMSGYPGDLVILRGGLMPEARS